MNIFGRKIDELSHELADLLAYPDEMLCSIIREVGFSCTLCGRCCTREMNDHVFLLEDDTDRIRGIDPAMLVPAPYFELCDQHGRFYVSGYALRMHPDGSCGFLHEGRCSIYPSRPAICRVYPYMLHREPDERGRSDWRQIAGLDSHGEYHTALADAECSRIAAETRAYEEAFLRQTIAFYRHAGELFSREGLRPVRRTYDRKMREFLAGAAVEVMVFHRDAFITETIRRSDYLLSASSR